MVMSKATTFSTVLDPAVKKAAVAYCKHHGLKLRHFVEQAIVEQLEDAVDLESYRQRKNEETVPLEQILRKRGARSGA